MFIVSFDKKVKGFKVIKGETIGFIGNKVEFKTFYGDVFAVDKGNVYDTLEIANTVRLERTVLKKFKDKNKNKNGMCTCAICGAKLSMSDTTVDHIVPLSEFKKEYGLKDIRDDSDVHREAWSVLNLQIACERCNQAKSSLDNDLNTYIENKSRKLHMHKNKNSQSVYVHSSICQKIGSYVKSPKNTRDAEIIYEMCVRDSRTIPLKLVL